MAGIVQDQSEYLKKIREVLVNKTWHLEYPGNGGTSIKVKEVLPPENGINSPSCLFILVGEDGRRESVFKNTIIRDR